MPCLFPSFRENKKHCQPPQRNKYSHYTVEKGFTDQLPGNFPFPQIGSGGMHRFRQASCHVVPTLHRATAIQNSQPEEKQQKTQDLAEIKGKHFFIRRFNDRGVENFPFIIKYHFYRGITEESQFCNFREEENVKAGVILQEKDGSSQWFNFYKTVRKVIIN